MDSIFEFILEIFMELYLGLAEIIVPDRKFKKWQTTLLKVLCTLVSLGILVLLVGGVLLIIDEERTNPTAGIVMTAVGASLMFVHIVLFVILLIKDIIKEKKKKASNKNAVDAERDTQVENDTQSDNGNN